MSGDFTQAGASRTLTVVPDANVLVHGKALVDLPWAELGRSQIEVVFVPPTIRELDKLKTQTGRPNKLARQLSSDIRALIGATGRRAVVRRADPQVIKRVELRPVTEPLNATLRLDHADQALINYALSLKRDGSDVLLITDDTICGATAEGVGLATLYLPENWLRAPEPDEGAREAARLRTEIQRLREAEPQVVLAFRTSSGEPVEQLDASIVRWPALSGDEVDGLMRKVETLCPPATSFERAPARATDSVIGNSRWSQFTHLAAMTPRTVYEPASVEEIERYKNEEYPGWLQAVRAKLEALHSVLEARAEPPTVVGVAANLGSRPADDTLVAFRVRGDLMMRNGETEDRDEDRTSTEDVIDLPLPPSPPRGRSRRIDPVGIYHGLDAASCVKTVQPTPLRMPSLSPPKPRDSDAFYWRAGRRDWTSSMELECASWRHGQDPETFPLQIRPRTQEDTTGVVELSVHAHNLSEPRLTRLPIRLVFEDGPTLLEADALVEMLVRHAGMRA